MIFFMRPILTANLSIARAFRACTRRCPATGLRHSGNPKTRRKIDVGHGWVAQLAEQWTENLVFAPRERFVPSHGCEHARPKKNQKDHDTVNAVSTALAHGRIALDSPMVAG